MALPGVSARPNTALTASALVNASNRQGGGKINPGYELTLRASQTTTVLTDPRISYASVFVLDPLTANAATELAAGTLYCLEANRVKGSATFTHASAVSTDRKYRVMVFG